MAARPGPIKLVMVAAACLGLADCGLIGPTQGNTQNRLQDSLFAIVPIAPADTAQAFLDSGTLSFATGAPSVLEYEGVWEQSSGGLGPHYGEVRMTVKTEPGEDSLEVVATGRLPFSRRIAFPPERYRKDTLPPAKQETWEAPAKVYPSESGAPWGIFLTNDGSRMLYQTSKMSAFQDDYREDRLLYLEPYGLIYARINRSMIMHGDYLEFWLTKWNGQNLDRNRIFGMAKGLLSAYPAPLDSMPPSLTW